jgi:hypothetical protein
MGGADLLLADPFTTGSYRLLGLRLKSILQFVTIEGAMMSIDLMIGPLPKVFQTRRGGLSEEEFTRVDPFVREALI